PHRCQFTNQSINPGLYIFSVFDIDIRLFNIVITIGYREVLVFDDLWPGLNGNCHVPVRRRFLSTVWWSLWSAGSGQPGTAFVLPECQDKNSGLLDMLMDVGNGSC